MRKNNLLRNRVFQFTQVQKNAAKTYAYDGFLGALCAGFFQIIR